MNFSIFVFQRLTNSMFDKAGCEINDLACMRALRADEALVASSTGAMGNDAVAMVLNSSFAPTHRSDLMPETLFDSIKNVSIGFILNHNNLKSMAFESNLILSEMFAQILPSCGPILVMNHTK